MQLRALKLPELAARMKPHVSYEMVRRYASGESFPRENHLEKLAKSLEVDKEWLRTGRQTGTEDIGLQFDLLSRGLALVEEYMGKHGVELPAKIQVRAAREIAKELSEGKAVNDDELSRIFLRMIA